jgi:anti-sigma B factor antagonist
LYNAGPDGSRRSTRDDFDLPEEIPMPDYHFLDVNRRDDTFVVRFRDSKLIDELVIVKVGKELFALAAEPEGRHVLLNFSGVDYLSSSFLSKLLSLRRRMEKKQGKLKLCEICPAVREIFAITKMDTLLDIVDTEERALAAVNEPAEPPPSE